MIALKITMGMLLFLHWVIEQKKMLKMAIAGFLRVCKKCLGIILSVGDKGTLQSKCPYLDNNVGADPSLLAELGRHRLGFCRRYSIHGLFFQEASYGWGHLPPFPL